MYTACMENLHGSYTAVYGPSTAVYGCCAAAYGPCTRPCNVSCTRPCTWPCNVSYAHYTAAVYTARENVFARKKRPAVPYKRPYTAVYGPFTRHVYATRVHDCVRAVCTNIFGRVRGAYTAPYTGRVHSRVHGRVRAVHTAVYTTRTRPRTRVYVSTCTRAMCTAVYGPSTRPKTAVRPCTGRIGSCTRQCTGPVHGCFRPCTLAMYTARVDEHVHGCVCDVSTTVYMASYGRVHGPRP